MFQIRDLRRNEHVASKPVMANEKVTMEVKNLVFTVCLKN